MSKKIINQNHKETAEWVKTGSYFFCFFILQYLIYSGLLLVPYHFFKIASRI